MSRILVRAGLAWCAAVVVVGSAAAVTEWLKAQPRTTIEGALTLSAIALFPGIFCFVLSWVFAPSREENHRG